MKLFPAELTAEQLKVNWNVLNEGEELTLSSRSLGKGGLAILSKPACK